MLYSENRKEKNQNYKINRSTCESNENKTLTS